MFSFINDNDSREHELRTVLIAYGRVNAALPRHGLSYLHARLHQLEAVLAFHNALKIHGGTGTLYILQKKSEREKLENHERHARKNDP